MSNPSDYTVGWICAITTEYVAAQSLLDEEHGKPEYVSTNDTNNYTLGKMSNHNVVITVLPGGEYGTNSAAIVATHMLHSFPNVQIGLMFGTGGGAPSPKQDIRLGDVVVSIPCNGFGGVFQYDYGKAIQGESFKPTRFLNQAPVVLRTAVNGLQAQYERKGHQIEETIGDVLEKHKRMRRKYKRPPDDHDRLYESHAVHPSNTEGNCAELCDLTKLISRPRPTEDEDNPMIHYGLIASANQLMCDALIRDRFIAENGVLCFEMEAAGLMNLFPCLVIRGICNYSDSHRNEEWQGYAAMTAAAYTKDLLHQIIPFKVEAETGLKHIIFGIHDSVQDLSQRVSNLESRVDSQERQNNLWWVPSSNYSPQQNNLMSTHQERGGKPFLESNEFQKWHNGQQKILFYPGGLNAEKKITTSLVVDYLLKAHRSDMTVGTAFVYCNSQQRHGQVLSSLLEQFSRQLPSLPQCVVQLYQDHEGHMTQPSAEDISGALQTVIEGFSRAFVIIDACDIDQDADFSALLSEIFGVQRKAKFKLFLTIRTVSEMEESFAQNTTLKIQDVPGGAQRDIEDDIHRLLSAVSDCSSLL